MCLSLSPSHLSLCHQKLPCLRRQIYCLICPLLPHLAYKSLFSLSSDIGIPQGCESIKAEVNKLNYFLRFLEDIESKLAVTASLVNIFTKSVAVDSVSQSPATEEIASPAVIERSFTPEYLRVSMMMSHLGKLATQVYYWIICRPLPPQLSGKQFFLLRQR